MDKRFKGFILSNRKVITFQRGKIHFSNLENKNIINKKRDKKKKLPINLIEEKKKLFLQRLKNKEIYPSIREKKLRNELNEQLKF